MVQGKLLLLFHADNQQDVVMEDNKENNIPGTNPHRSSGVLRLARLRRNHDRDPRNPAQPLLTEKYKNVKRKFEEADKVNFLTHYCINFPWVKLRVNLIMRLYRRTSV